MERTYLFWDSSKSLVPAQVENELSSFSDILAGLTPITSIVFKTPNGLHTYRLSVDNDGSLVTEQIT